MPAKRIEISEIPYPDGINGELKAMQICMAASGAEASFATLMGVSGLSFRLYFHTGRPFDAEQGRWDPQSLEVYDGEHPCTLAAPIAGFSYTLHARNSLNEMFEHVKASIEAGVPAVTRGPVGSTEASIIVGYSEDEKRKVRKLDVITKLAGEQVTSLECPPIDMAWVETEDWRNPVGVLTKTAAPSDDERKSILRDALKRAAAAIDAPPVHDERFIGGISAYNALADSLDGDIDAVWDPENVMLGDHDARVLFLGSLIAELGGARRLAVEFLDMCAETWSQLGAAAEAYAKLEEPFTNLRQAFPCPFSNSMEQATAALMSEPHRQSMAGWLRHMGEVEKAAAEVLKPIAEAL